MYPRCYHDGENTLGLTNHPFMYLGLRQYQLHFDLLGLGIICAVFLMMAALIWQAARGSPKLSLAFAGVLITLCAVQIHRGWMVPDSAWLTMLGAIETADNDERVQRIQELRQSWNATADTMRATDWYAISTRWNVCHLLWKQAQCNDPTPSENAVGVARDLLSSMAATSPPSSQAL